MEQNLQSERKFLLLAVVAGLCGSATLSTLFADSVAFSIFPIIAFVLAVYCFYQQHVTQPLTEGTPMIAFACFLVGAFGYSAFVRMQLPELGGNFFSIIVTMALGLWVLHKMGWLTVTKKKEAIEE
ncbi:YijD family membrane protein [Enterovibrio coralii]|uniref:Uncharacterized protein n=1 Tax=Enterovibrio coralii TaxID=294935 RepID=A0A135IAQ7_9GAMM|nr:YijD family membrane protein [Enterovibrio coralii]KXF82541.1 hypothetical protein ATN88_21140 [Enterovibrio coralii]